MMARLARPHCLNNMSAQSFLGGGWLSRCLSNLEARPIFLVEELNAGCTDISPTGIKVERRDIACTRERS